MKHYQYSPAQIRSWLRAMRRAVRQNQFRCLVEYGQLDLGGEG